MCSINSLLTLDIWYLQHKDCTPSTHKNAEKINTTTKALKKFLRATAANAHLTHRNSVCPSVRHTTGSVKNGAS